MKALFFALSALYPVAVFFLLVVFKVPIRVLSLAIIILAAAFFLTFTASGKTKKSTDPRALLCATLLLILGTICFFTNQTLFLKSYSVIINLTFLTIFSSTLIKGPNICYRFACLGDKNIKGSNYEGAVIAYCKCVTIVWCVFFILNGAAATFTTFFDFGSAEKNNKVWSAYNGGISYGLMFLIFFIEGTVRHFKDKKMVKAYPITKLTEHSWKLDRILSYDGVYTEAVKKNTVKTFGDFLRETAIIRNFIDGRGYDKFLIHIEDYWYFLCTLVALLQKKKEVHLIQNTSKEFLKEVFSSDMEYLTDEKIKNILKDNESSGGADAGNVKLKDKINDEIKECAKKPLPQIISDDTKIYLYTSGSTGHPKKVLQRMTEFECDNAFVYSKWGEEIIKRKLVSTVSAHHIYGFLFDITLPFTLGIPFKRKRLEQVEEFEALTDTSYIIITTPAFLKRVTQGEEHLQLKDPFIFTSGGACSKELAKDTERVMGFCPQEIYGSTETSGIAYRQQSKDGERYRPFDNAKVWLGGDGCLRIISPYIKDPAGFATSDLAKMNSDGTFTLLGRCDSIVKIEEKRISLTEVENRLLSSGFVKDAKVIALENNVRQYLAAVIAFNDEGEKKFSSLDKKSINDYFHNYLIQFFENVTVPKRWRFVKEIPCDAQGKKHKEEMERLFLDEKS